MVVIVNEVNRRMCNSWGIFRKHTLELYDRSSALVELKIRILNAAVSETYLYGWTHQTLLTRCIGCPIFYIDTLVK